MSASVEQPSGKSEGLDAMWRRAANVGLLIFVIAATGAFAYRLLFSQFEAWDDEGYFLLALRAYREGHGLYERIETIYGPFYFQFVSGLFSLLRIPLDNVGARWFVLCVWMVACLAARRYVQRVTASAVAGLLAYVLTFPILMALGNEPLHPGGLIVLLLSAIILVSLGLEGRARPSVSLAACGVLTAAIALTKLNVGLFTLIAFMAFFLRTPPRSRAGMALRIGAAVFLPVLPFCLMAPLMEREGIRGFAIFVSLSLLPFGFLPWLDLQERWPRRAVPYLLGGLALTIVVLALCLFGGTGPAGLWRSLVLDTLHFAGAFVYPPREEWSATLLALAATPIGIGALMRWTPLFGQVSRTLLKFVGGLVLLILCLTPPVNPMLGLPLVWLVAVPGPSSRGRLETRTLLGLLVALQSLHAYPVAGSQVAFFSYLLPVVGVITVWDALGDLPIRWREPLSHLRWKAISAATVTLILATCYWTSGFILLFWNQYDTGVPLGLPGAEPIRLPESRAAVLQWITSNLQHNADTFVGLPGVHSFYGWSTLPPPVAFYPHTWILFNDDGKEAELVQALLAAKRPCIIRNRSLIDFWMPGRSPNSGALVRTAEREFRVAAAVGTYEFLVPLTAHPDFVLSVFPVPAPQELIDRYRAQSAFRLAFPAIKGVHVARIVVRDTESDTDVFDSAADSPARRPAILSPSGTDLLQGNPPLLIDLSRRSDVLMLCPPTTARVSSQTGIVRAFDEQGRIVARLLLPVEPRTR